MTATKPKPQYQWVISLTSLGISLLATIITVTFSYGKFVNKTETTSIISTEDHKMIVEILQKVSSLDAKTTELEKRLPVVEQDIKKMLECAAVIDGKKLRKEP